MTRFLAIAIAFSSGSAPSLCSSGRAGPGGKYANCAAAEPAGSTGAAEVTGTGPGDDASGTGVGAMVTAERDAGVEAAFVGVTCTEGAVGDAWWWMTGGGVVTGWPGRRGQVLLRKRENVRAGYEEGEGGRLRRNERVVAQLLADTALVVFLALRRRSDSGG